MHGMVRIILQNSFVHIVRSFIRNFYMNEWLLFAVWLAVVIVMVIGFSLGYQKLNLVNNRLLKIDLSTCAHKQVSESSGNKAIDEINELENLKGYISSLKVSKWFIDSCLKKIEAEIEIQEYSCFKELGKEVYKNKKENIL